MTTKLRIATLIAGTLILLTFVSMPAIAAPRHLIVTLLGGKQVSLTVDADPSTPAGSIPLPDLGMPVVAVSEAPSAAPPATVTTAPPTTATTPPTTTATNPGRPTTLPTTTPLTTTSAAIGGIVKPKGKVKVEGSAVAVPRTAPQDGTAAAPTLADATPAQQPGAAQPTPSSPGFTIAPPGPAPIGVPNFFIDKFRIPPFLLPIYQAAGIAVRRAAGRSSPRSTRSRPTTAATSTSPPPARSAGCSSCPSTWEMYGVDANDDGVKDPYNPVDAIFAAARYLKAAGADTDIRRAIFAYNHADWYVDSRAAARARDRRHAGRPRRLAHRPDAGPLPGRRHARRYADGLTAPGRHAPRQGQHERRGRRSRATRRAARHQHLRQAPARR